MAGDWLSCMQPASTFSWLPLRARGTNTHFHFMHLLMHGTRIWAQPPRLALGIRWQPMQVHAMLYITPSACKASYDLASCMDVCGTLLMENRGVAVWCTVVWQPEAPRGGVQAQCGNASCSRSVGYAWHRRSFSCGNSYSVPTTPHMYEGTAAGMHIHGPYPRNNQRASHALHVVTRGSRSSVPINNAPPRCTRVATAVTCCTRTCIARSLHTYRTVGNKHM